MVIGNDTEEDPMTTTPAPLPREVSIQEELALLALRRDYGITTLGLEHQVADYLDNYGEHCEHCEHCATSPRMVNTQAYFTSMATGEEVMLDGCANCMIKAIAADADSDHRVVLETARIGRRR